MDFKFNEIQAELVALADSVLSRSAGPERAREVLDGTGYDGALEAALGEAGLLDLATDPDAGFLESTLVVERVAFHQGLVAIGARALVMPALELDLEGPIALASSISGQPIRFGAQAKTVIVLGEQSAQIARVESWGPSGFMTDYTIATTQLSVVDDLGPESHAVLSRWWRIALSAEIVGLADAALLKTLGYVSERVQFGRALGALQAIQHRLAEVHVAIEGARWQTRYAAYLERDDEAAANAAESAVEAARLAIWELHQLTGAIGFTKEYDLHLMTMRLHALRVELDGVSGGHARAAADLRWDVNRPPTHSDRESAIMSTMSPRS